MMLEVIRITRRETDEGLWYSNMRLKSIPFSLTTIYPMSAATYSFVDFFVGALTHAFETDVVASVLWVVVVLAVCTLLTVWGAGRLWNRAWNPLSSTLHLSVIGILLLGLLLSLTALHRGSNNDLLARASLVTTDALGILPSAPERDIMQEEAAEEQLSAGQQNTVAFCRQMVGKRHYEEMQPEELRALYAGHAAFHRWAQGLCGALIALLAIVVSAFSLADIKVK